MRRGETVRAPCRARPAVPPAVANPTRWAASPSAREQRARRARTARSPPRDRAAAPKPPTARARSRGYRAKPRGRTSRMSSARSSTRGRFPSSVAIVVLRARPPRLEIADDGPEEGPVAEPPELHDEEVARRASTGGGACAELAQLVTRADEPPRPAPPRRRSSDLGQPEVHGAPPARVRAASPGSSRRGSSRGTRGRRPARGAPSRRPRCATAAPGECGLRVRRAPSAGKQG